MIFILTCFVVTIQFPKDRETLPYGLIIALGTPLYNEQFHLSQQKAHY